MSTSTASPSCSAARDTRITTDPQAHYNVRIIAGPGPGLSSELRRDCPLLVAVDGLGTRPAATIRRLLMESDGSAFFADRRSTSLIPPAPPSASGASSSGAASPPTDSG